MTKYRKDRQIPSITTEPITRLPSVPTNRRDTWDKETKALWKTTNQDLIARGRLEKVTLHVVRQYCDCHYIYEKAWAEIAELESLTTKDRKTDRKNPVYGEARRFLEQMNVLEKKLGVTPYSRDRISQAEAEDESDPLDDL